MTWRCGRILQERHSEGLKVKKNSGVEILKKHENKFTRSKEKTETKVNGNAV
jgi:hypothetical protein